jgi:hypothetical protein
MQAQMTDVNPPTPKIRSAAGGDKSVARQRISRNRIEDVLREELRRLLVTPVEEFARLQVARLDAMILRLVGRVLDGDLEAIDVVLMVVNALDRVPGGIEAHRFEPCSEEVRARPAQKLCDAAARLARKKWMN